MNYQQPNLQYQGYTPQPPKKDNKNTIIIVCVIVAVCILFLFGVFTFVLPIFNAFLSLDQDSDFDIGYGASVPSYDNIAVVYISGTISSVTDGLYDHTWLIDTIKSLTEDTNNKAMCIVLNTPGGGVYQTDEVYLELLKYKATGRPIYAYMEEVCASGGYYIACAADEIYANRNTLTGSIGVLLNTVYDISDLLEKMGVKTTTVTAGKNKNMGSYFDELTDEQRAIFQSICDESYDQFVSIVSDGRGMPVSTVERIADGRVYTAKQAKDNGLIDGIMTFDDFFTYVSSSVSPENDIPFTDYSFYYSYSLFDMFGMGMNSKAVSSEEALLKEILGSTTLRPVYYCLI